MKSFFKNQIVLVTGGSSGIGLEIARQLSQQGAHVWLLARRAELLAAALEIVTAARGSPDQRFGMVSADVSDPTQAMAAVQQVTSEIGLPDLVINAAGVAQPGYIQELDLEKFHWMMDINYFGIVYITKTVIPGMIQRGSGCIVNISSAAGFLAGFGYSAYAASKYAVTGFSDVLRSEMKPHGIRVSAVFPSDVDTPQLAYETSYQPLETQALAPLRSVMKTEAVARATLRGIARGQYIILPGFDSKLMYGLTRILGTAFFPLFDILLSVLIRRKLKKQADNRTR
jgi:3-dehydrosphinganine reductase